MSMPTPLDVLHNTSLNQVASWLRNPLNQGDLVAYVPMYKTGERIDAMKGIFGSGVEFGIVVRVTPTSDVIVKFLKDCQYIPLSEVTGKTCPRAALFKVAIVLDKCVEPVPGARVIDVE